MARFIALLRGVNVGGNVLKMDRLREVCEGLGFTNVQTYVQSGNAVFDCKQPQSGLCSILEKRLIGETRLPVSVIVRTIKEMEAIIAANPFLKEKGIDAARLYVTFLAAAAPKDANKMLSAIKAGKDRYRVIGNEIFLHCPISYGETTLSNNAIQKAVGVNATTRNWNTINKLLGMAK
jgi:uncharacterized protein (DUF1697 family)